jgi:5-methylcytosine-specific restriction enzyme subunit McrC
METEPPPGQRCIGRIPVRNLWLLMLYASDLVRHGDAFSAIVEEDIDELPDLIARLLADSVEHRLRRNLTRGYHRRGMVLTRVRGRIDVLATEARLLSSKGEVFCRFADLTTDTPRNRLVRAALSIMERLARSSELRFRCRSLASSLARAGVGGVRPCRSELAIDHVGRNNSGDRFMIALASLAFDLALPTESSGPTALVKPDQEETWVRKLFEKAVLGFARGELEPLGWSVRSGLHLGWQTSSESKEFATLLPCMITDIVLDAPGGGSRVVIDTKFASILASNRVGDSKLKSGYMYQMYAYIRSQEGRAVEWDTAEGLFVHPAVQSSLYERVVIQKHRITFATVDLSGSTLAIRTELRKILHGGIILSG